MILLASKEHAQIRYEICKSCEHFQENLKICKKCKCFMPAKVSLARARCPVLKWHQVDNDRSLKVPYEVTE